MGMLLSTPLSSGSAWFLVEWRNSVQSVEVKFGSRKVKSCLGCKFGISSSLLIVFDCPISFVCFLIVRIFAWWISFFLFGLE